MTDLTKDAPAAEPDLLRERAIDAMMAVFAKALGLSAPHRHNVADALDAAAAVFDADHDAAVQDMMDRSLLAGMNIGPDGMTVKAITAREVAVSMAMAAAQFLDENPGARNYVQQDVWDKDQQNRYTIIFMKPGGQTPHELREAAEKRLAAALALVANRRMPIDPREVAAALGEAPVCTCPGGQRDWFNDFDPDCPRHGAVQPTENEIRELLVPARNARHWAMGAWHELYERSDQLDPVVVNIVVGVLGYLRRGQWEEAEA